MQVTDYLLCVPPNVCMNRVSFILILEAILAFSSSLLIDSLRAWANEMHALIISEALSSDLLGAELLIKRHEEYKHDIDKQCLKYEELQESGRSLVNDGHFMSMQVS